MLSGNVVLVDNGMLSDNIKFFSWKLHILTFGSNSVYGVFICRVAEPYHFVVVLTPDLYFDAAPVPQHCLFLFSFGF
jgi:hypothetical protein